MVPSRLLNQRRGESFTYGIDLCERLLSGYMARYGSTDRPFLKDVVDELIEEDLGARLREDVLPLDRYAQSELVGGRIIVSLNRRTGEIPGVKHVEGVLYVAKWHEAVHVDAHLKPSQAAVAGEPQPLPLFADVRPRLIACRGAGWQWHELPEWEFTAEYAGLAAAIAPADLLRCESFLEVLERARRGGDLGRSAWPLLYDTAERIGVNPPALVRYLEFRGVCRVATGAGGSTLVADPRLFETGLWLDAERAAMDRLDTNPSGRSDADCPHSGG